MVEFQKVNLPILFETKREQITKFEWDLLKTLNELVLNLDAILNRGIKFSDNVDCTLVSFTSSVTPDAENTVAHILGKIPTGYIVYTQDKAASVYKGTTAWTATNIYLKCSVATVAIKILVF